jgi:hypothetical protein
MAAIAAIGVVAILGCSSGDIGNAANGDDSGAAADSTLGADAHGDATGDARGETPVDARADSTSTPDSPSTLDTSTLDSTSTLDCLSTLDTSTAVDSTSKLDTSSPTDTAIVDSTSTLDTASTLDSTSTLDSLSTIDTSRLDTGSTIDTGTTIDTGPTTGSPIVAGCTIFPPDNPWNTRIDSYPLSAHSTDYLATMNVTKHLHADWGTFTDLYGIPWDSGTGAASKHMDWSVSYGFTESDTLPCTDGSGYSFCYPIPFTVHIEGGPAASTGSDRHVNWLDTGGAPDHCILYEVYNAQNPPDASGGWTAQNGAIFHLDSDALRPDGWTSADAAGLSVFAGLVKYDEVAAGEIRHAIRFTMASTSKYFIHPATHHASSLDLYYPPMGLRLRLKSSVSITAYTPEAQVILRAMQRYGIIVADNGSDWYISGDTNDGWAAIIGGIGTAFNAIVGSDFEVVETGTPTP